MRSPLKPDSRSQRARLCARGKTGLGQVSLIMAIVLLIVTPGVIGQEYIAAQFKQSCASCHWIGGGRLVGPDLRNVSERQERDFLVRFILNPKAMLDAQDPYIMKLQDEASGAIMTNVPDMNRGLAEALLDFIDAESQLDSSQFFGTPAALEPFSEEIAAAGLNLFKGDAPLTNAGPPCISCHNINTEGSGLGGQLAPELTGVFERLNGRTAITAWLASPPTATMRSIFKDHQLEEIETKQLAMFFESVSGQTGYSLDKTMEWMLIVLLGLGGGGLGLAAFGGIWKNRFRAVRRPLINEMKKQKKQRLS